MIQDTSGQDKVVQPSRLASLKWWLIPAAAVAVLALLGWRGVTGSEASHSVPRADLVMDTLTRGTLVRDVVTRGKIVAANAPVLYSTEEGTVSLLANPGDKVVKDDIVARLHSPSLTNELKQQQAVLDAMSGEMERAKLDARRQLLTANQALDMARVELEAADRESRRGDLLIDSNLISRIDFEKGKDDLKKAKLLYAHAGQEVALMQDTQAFELKNKQLDVDRQQLVVDDLHRQVEALAIRAPVDGIIGNWLTEQQARIGRAQPILTVVDLSAFEAELAVSETYADELGLGMEVELNFGDIILYGELSSISPEVRNREVTARVRFDHQDAIKLRQNQRLSARILLEHRANVLMVRRGAFVTEGGGLEAYLMEGDTASRVDVKLGARSMSHIEVLEGGREGDLWVISGVDRFNNAEQIRVY